MFLGRRRQELALEVLRVRHVLQDLPPAPLADDPVCLSADLPFGRALVALADRGDAAVVVDGQPAHPVSARALQARILDDLKAAGASADQAGNGGGGPG